MITTKKVLSVLLISSSLFGAGAASAFAFSDVQDNNQRAMVESLQKKGIIQGVSADKFAPQKVITSAQAIQMIVKATGLQMNPNFSGKSFSTVPDGAWYADAVNIAVQHGLPVTAETKWNEPILREDFAKLLAAAVQQTGDYPLIMMYINVADEKNMKEESRGAVQFLLLTKITELEEGDKFLPKHQLTRMEAAQMIYAAMQFIQNHKQDDVKGNDQAGEDISIQIVKVNNEVNKVILTKDDLPHPGYGIAVTSIDFTNQNEAIVYYSITQPDPDMMYPQVISKASTEAYVPSKYKIKVKADKAESVNVKNKL
ncbi:protease complex subunit PrcB family protein [Paenibacillus dakarensis]|uniref:protease complex subunit PrcB family protein n=1 Tax=Paenibacillus dakarensis TaxID=1527293 RepID=UPI0006D582CC|nr:S-layer homology domain-containing protein [Paenibacillus dakarensis]